MNKKLVLSVLSTAVVASMASAAMAKPEAGFYVGGEVDKYYSIDAFFDNFDDALNEIIDEIGDTVFVDTNANAAPFVEALNAETTEDLNAILKPATVATFNGNVYANVGDPTKPYDPAKDPDLEPGLSGELKVESVSAIESTIVEVTFPELAEAQTGVTVEVKDSKGEVRAVVARDIAKGATKAQFDFVTPIKAEDLTGVWSVDGISYSFDELKLVEDIVTEAKQSTVNEVKLFELLTKAGIKNVNTDKIADYAQAIGDASPAPVWASDVQKIVDDANKAGEDKDAEAAVVKAVVDATNQIQLLAVLEANFDHVNKDWITVYAGASVTGSSNTLLNLDGKTTPTDYDVKADDIQAAIYEVNGDLTKGEIKKANDAAAKSADQAKVTALIENWMKADDPKTPNVTTKADAIKTSKAKEAAFKVAEATTENSLYNALVAYANATPDATLKASELNANLKAEYKKALDASGVQAALVAAIQAGTENIKGDIVTAADTAALSDAIDTVNTTAGAYDATDAKTTTAFQKALQKLADVTSHQTGDAKFDASKVNTELLEKYAAAIDSLSTPASTAKDVQDAIKGVNDTAGTDASVDAINKATTATQVKAALDTLAISAYVNVPSADKLYIAEKVLEARDELTGKEFADKDEVETALGTTTTTGILKDYADLVAEFNASNLTDTETTIAALSKLEYAAFDNLSAGQKADVAEKFVADYPVDKDGAPVNYKTLAAVKAGVDAAIAAN